MISQKTDFDFEIIVHDDCSTDDTTDILREYAVRYPQLIVPIYEEENQYYSGRRIVREMAKNIAKGKYIAFCEGDDYWLNENKLQLQVNYMETHPNCSLIAHAARWINCQDGTERGYHPYEQTRDLTAEEVILQNNGNLSTASLLARREVYFCDERFPKVDVGDIPIQLNAILKGSVHYFDDEMCAYRYMRPGSWGATVGYEVIKQIKHDLRMLSFLGEYDNYSKRRFKGAIRKRKLYYMSLINRLYGQLSQEEKDELLLLHDKYLNEIIKVSRISNGDIIVEEADVEQLSNRKHVVIYGCGGNAAIIGNMLDKMGIAYDGFLISDGQDGMGTKYDKPVWTLSDYPYDFEETAIVVSAGQNYEEEIIKALSPYKGYYLLTPLWYRVNNV
jgi:glycosyltransferase involved in cell wall biosynthesis